MQHGATYLAGSVDTDAEWLAVARSTVNDVVRQFTIHPLSVTARSHAVQSTPLRYCSQQHNNNSLLRYCRLQSSTYTNLRNRPIDRQRQKRNYK